MKITKKNIIIGIIVLLIIWIGSFFAIRYFFPVISNSGAFGDSFGAINSVFSGLAFLGIIITIVMQSEELRLQRAELKMTRDELAKAANAQSDQVEIQKSVARLTAYTALYNNANPNTRKEVGGKYIRTDLHYKDKIEEVLSTFY